MSADLILVVAMISIAILFAVLIFRVGRDA